MSLFDESVKGHVSTPDDYGLKETFPMKLVIEIHADRWRGLLEGLETAANHLRHHRDHVCDMRIDYGSSRIAVKAVRK